MSNSFFCGREFALDSLTKVYVREVIVEYMNFLISQKIPFSFSIVDIDNFKYVNDSYGHIVGDKTLYETAKKIKSSLGPDDVLGRIGGDEFALIFPELVEYDKVWQRLRKIHQSVNGLEIKNNKGLRVTATFGLARCPVDASSYKKLIEIADKALYRGKTKGRNCFIIYLPEKHANIVVKAESETNLSSMYLHSMVFRILTTSESLEKGIAGLFDFLSSYFMLDHICLQTEDKIKFEKIHRLSKCRSFEPIPLRLYENGINASTEIFYVNNREFLAESNQSELYGEFLKFEIRAAFVARVSCAGKSFGILRVDSTSGKIWQYTDMDILLTTARVIGLILNMTGRTIDSLEDIKTDSEESSSD